MIIELFKDGKIMTVNGFGIKWIKLIRPLARVAHIIIRV